MRLLILSTVVFYFQVSDFVCGFPLGLDRSSEDLIRQKRAAYFLNLNDGLVLWRTRRDEESAKSAWDEKQATITKLKELKDIQGENSEEGYDSYKQKWSSSWTNGPIERRLHSLKIFTKTYGFPLSLPLPGRPDPYKAGHYKELNDAGVML